MPYVGQRNGQLVSPLDVGDHETVLCPECGGHLGVRAGHYNRGKLIARHFFHRSGGCPGESDTHLQMKTIACYKLQQVFPFAEIDDEVPIGDRISDAAATFPEPIKPFGDGFVIEVQHKNKGKNIGQVSQEYLDNGYSVFWAYQSDFNGHRMEFAPHRARVVWPDTLPDRTGLDGYPDVIQQLWTNEFASPSPRRIPFPGEYWRTHELELISPVQGVVEHDWTELDDVWLHSVGRQIAWWSIYRSPAGETYLELWVKDRKRNQTKHIPVRVALDDLSDVGDCLAAYRTHDGSASTPETSTIASAVFSGTQNTRGWVAILNDQSGNEVLQFGRQDSRGNTRTICLEIREGDIERLETLGQRLARLFEV